MKSNKIKVVLLCGFLGAGKTTLLSYLLKHPNIENVKKAVLVNDFGALPVDAALLPKGDFYVSELNRGSLFCVCVKSDLLKMLEKIAHDISPELLFVEATGLAEPRDFMSLVSLPHLRDRFISGPVICVVDALNYSKLSSILPVLRTQIKVADLVIINKKDRVSSESIEKIIDEVRLINPGATVITTTYCEFSPNEFDILGLGHENKDTTERKEVSGPPSYMEKFEFRFEKSIDKEWFQSVITQYRDIIFRAKGVVLLDSQKYYMEVVNGEIFLKNGENITLKSEYPCALSFILRVSDKTESFKKIMSCPVV